MKNRVEELVEWVAQWVLDGGLTCMGCESTGGENLECEEKSDSPARICSALRKDIYRLLSHPDLALIDREHPYAPISLAEALKEGVK